MYYTHENQLFKFALCSDGLLGYNRLLYVNHLLEHNCLLYANCLLGCNRLLYVNHVLGCNCLLYANRLLGYNLVKSGAMPLCDAALLFLSLGIAILEKPFTGV
jgi:hypothetical protein